MICQYHCENPHTDKFVVRWGGQIMSLCRNCIVATHGEDNLKAMLKAKGLK